MIVTILAKEVGRLGVLNRVEEKLDKIIDRIDKGSGKKEDANKNYKIVTELLTNDTKIEFKFL